MAISQDDIRNFVMANLDNPEAIAAAAKQYGVNVDQIASAVGVSKDVVNN
jgi:hypothetical protein